MGNADGAVGIFGKCRARVGYGPAPGPTIKRPFATLARWVGRSTNTAAVPLYDDKYWTQSFVNISLLTLNRVLLLCTDFGSTSVATYGSRNALTPKALQVPRQLRQKDSRISSSSYQRTRSIKQQCRTRKINLVFLHQRLYTKIFRLLTSVTN